MALVSRAYPREERGRALGLWAAASTLTTALRPVLGGVIPAVLGTSVIWQAVVPNPMTRLGLFRRRTFAVTTLVTLFLYFGLNGVMFSLPMTAVSAWGVTALDVTAAFLPISVLIGLLSAPAP